MWLLLLPMIHCSMGKVSGPRAWHSARISSLLCSPASSLIEGKFSSSLYTHTAKKGLKMKNKEVQCEYPMVSVSILKAPGNSVNMFICQRTYIFYYYEFTTLNVHSI